MDLNTTLRRSYDTEMLILRTLFALDPDTNMPISTNFVLTTDGIGGLVWQNPFDNLSTAGAGLGYLPSTIESLRSNVSSMSSILPALQSGLSSLSTALGQAYISTGIYTFQLTSTVEGLATSGYVSTSQLASTVQGLASASYISSPQLVSTVAWFQDPSRYVSTGALVSTTAGLMPYGQLVSTVQGLGTMGYISSLSLTSSLTSTVSGLSTTIFSTFYSTLVPQFISPLQLTSSISSLATLGYVSSSQLASTVAWLTDPSRYVSSGNVVSSIAALSTSLQNTYYIDNGGNFNILGGTVIVSSVQSVVFLSTFVLSSLTYKGTNGIITPVRYPDATTGNHMFFSSATLSLDTFSSFITSRSRVNLELYPTFVFPRLNTGATAYSLINMSTLVAYSNTYLPTVASSWVYAGNQTIGFGNVYQQPIQLQIPGSILQSNFTSEYRIVHNLVSSVTSNLAPGFVNTDIEIQFGSTNSVFLSIQNLP